MKELSIEEKAKRYDEAIKIAKEINNERRAQSFNVMTRVFPELKESEDEKIRKSLINHFQCIAKNGDNVWTNLDYNKVIAWLEKQGEQKPVWSWEDERIYQSIMDDIVQENQLDDKQTDWLRDIKYRYSQ